LKWNILWFSNCNTTAISTKLGVSKISILAHCVKVLLWASYEPLCIVLNFSCVFVVLVRFIPSSSSSWNYDRDDHQPIIIVCVVNVFIQGIFFLNIFPITTAAAAAAVKKRRNERWSCAINEFLFRLLAVTTTIFTHVFPLEYPLAFKVIHDVLLLSLLYPSAN